MSEEDFEARLESAIQRGKRRANAGAAKERAEQLSEEELRRMHTSFRLSLSERIEKAIHRVADHFPGFREESLFGEVGWGMACYRDDLKIVGGKRENRYSRLEMTIRPLNDLKVLDLKGKGTVSNRELFNRSYFIPIAEVDQEEFAGLIDSWAIEYAEVYATKANL